MTRMTECSTHTANADVSFRTRIMSCAEAPYAEFVVFELRVDGADGLRYMLYMDRSDLPQLRDRMREAADAIDALLEVS